MSSGPSTPYALQNAKSRPASYTLHVTIGNLQEQIPAIITISHMFRDTYVKIEIIPKNEVYENNMYIAKQKSGGGIELLGNAKTTVGYNFCRELAFRFNKPTTLHCKIKLTGRLHLWCDIKRTIRDLVKERHELFFR